MRTNKTGAAKKHDAERDLRAHGELAEALRAFRCGSSILAKRVGEIGTQKMQHRSDAEKQARDQRDAKVKSRTRASIEAE